MKSSKFKLLNILLTLALAITMMPAFTQTAYAGTDVYTNLIPTGNEEALAAKQVTFNNKPWYIIADNSTSATAGSVTLLVADTSFGTSTFGSNNTYVGSTVKGTLDALTQSGGAFADVADAIINKKDNETDIGKLYLLSVNEAGQLSENVRKLKFDSTFDNHGKWWLRTSGSTSNVVSIVYGDDGGIVYDGSGVTVSQGVRPALQLDLSKVSFDSESKTFSLKPSHTHDEIVFTSWTSKNSLPSEAGNYYLNNNVTLSDAWTVPEGITNLCLNGHTIKYNGRKGYANIIDVNSSATLNLYDEEVNNGKIQGFECTSPGNLGTVNVNGGSFTMHGGTIQGPGSNYVTGGGVFVGNSGNATISGGTVTGYSNGVLTSSSSSHKNSITVTGGNITNNGTGIAFRDSKNLTITGGRITGNYTGIRMTSYSADFSVSGTPYIDDNRSLDNSKSNLYFVDNYIKLNIKGELSEEASIGVKSNNYPFIFTNGWNTYMSGKNPTDYFSSDNNNYSVLQEGNELKLGKPHTHEWSYTAEGAVITATCADSDGGHGTPKTATLTIAAAGGTYDGTTSFGATITDANAIQGDAKVVYQKKNGESYDEATETAPTDAGDYKASITLGSGNNTATASIEYTIEKADPNPSSNLTGSAKYGQKHQDISLNMPFDSTPGDWSWVDPDASVGSIGEHTFSINFTPDDAANYKSLSNVPVTVTVEKADNPATVTPTASVKKGGNELDLANSVTRNGATGTVSYEFLDEEDTKDCTLSGSKLISGNVTGDVKVLVFVGADDIYKALETKLITVTITKNLQTITAQDVTVTYGDTGKKVTATVTEPATGGGTISYAVKAGSEDYIDVDPSSGELTIKKAGTATVTVSAAGTDDYEQATKDVTVTINKADSVATAPAASATYGQTLADVALTNPDVNTPGTWAFTDAGTTSVGNAGQNTFTANFTPTDSVNYNSVSDVNITVSVAKANPSYTAPSANTLTYNKNPQALITAGSTEDGTMKYSTDGTNYSAAIPAGTDAGPYTVYYKVEGDKNHNNTDPQNFTVTIAQADPSSLLPSGYSTVAEPEDYLGSVKLPEGWTWVNGEQYVSSQEGTYTFPAKYTADTKNYKQDPVDITVVVSKAYYDYVSGSSSGVWTKGSAGTLSFTFKRSQKDELTYGCFAKASYDGSNEMTKNTDFKIAEGSLIINLEDSLLNSLSIGVHTLNITFEDGTAVTTFKVVEKSSGSDSSSTDYNPPKTGIE